MIPSVRHVPKRLADPPTPTAAELVEAGRTGRLVLYLGAGLSIPSPSCGPRGNEVADRLRPFIADLLGVDVADLIEADLEALASRVARDASDRLPQLKVRAGDIWPFNEMEPNYGHEMVALLMREGLVEAVSANWDCGIENGGQRLAVRIEPVATGADRLCLGTGDVPLFKVHGCARRPDTLIITREEVDDPQRWAKAEVQHAMAGRIVVFVGLGTVGSYVGESVEDLLNVWAGGAATTWVIDPGGPSEPWQEALGDRAAAQGIAMGGDEFLDDLVRAAATDALSRVAAEARDMAAAQNEPWANGTVAGVQVLRDALADSHGDAVLRWWRQGVTTGLDGRRFVFEPSGQTALLCVAQLIGLDGGGVEAVGADGDLTIRGARGYFEIAYRPLAMRDEVERRARARVARSRRAGRYATGVPVTVAVHGAKGTFPAADAKPDIAAAEPVESDIGTADDAGVFVVKAEDALDGRLVA